MAEGLNVNMLKELPEVLLPSVGRRYSWLLKDYTCTELIMMQDKGSDAIEITIRLEVTE